MYPTFKIRWFKKGSYYSKNNDISLIWDLRSIYIKQFQYDCDKIFVAYLSNKKNKIKRNCNKDNFADYKFVSKETVKLMCEKEDLDNVF